MNIKDLYDKDISLYRNVFDRKGKKTTLISALNYIEYNYDNVEYIIEFIRKEKDKKKIEELKKQLPGVTWSGFFSSRKSDKLLEHSGYICIDIDNIDNIPQLKKEISTSEYVFACFVSPSGNGLKILFNIAIALDTHINYFNALVNYVNTTYGVVVDITGSDVSRLCFLSHDPDMYVASTYTLVNDEFIKKWLPKKKNASKVDIIVNYLEKCDEITRQTHQPGPGKYNAYIITFSIFANRYGISEIECTNHLQGTCPDHNHKETKASVKSTYDKFSHEFGIWKNGKKVSKKQIQSSTHEFITQNKFWYEIKNDKTGKTEYKFGYDDAIIFLQQNGFYRYPINNDSYQFIHIKEDIKQVEVIAPIKVKDFFLKYLKNNETTEYKAVREMFRRGAKNYCSINLLEGLDYYKPTFKKDTEKSAYVYFRNCYIEITADDIKTKKYNTLDNYIWTKQVIDFDYTPQPYEEADFVRFITLAIIGKKIPQSELNEIQIKKIESFSTTIGYLLHRYKNPALTKAVIAVDKRLRTTGENNGRTGKSLLSKALSKMLNVCLIDGKNFKFDNPFPFQKANIDTELINFNDVLKNFDFERLFGMITEEFTFEKKGKDSITLNFEDSPKFYISTNTSLKGSGESNKGRQQIIEFDNYFNTEHTPVKEFGRMFFYDWDDSEFCKFYTYMIECVQYFLKHGLIDFPLENYEINKLIDTAGEEFVDYMNETVLEQLQFGLREFDNKILYEKFISENKNREKTNIKTFNKNVKTWATINGLEINAHKNGERDKRGPHTFFTFTAARLTSN